MLESHLPRKRDRTYFNSLSSHAGVMDYLEEEMGLDLMGGKETGEWAREEPRHAELTPPSSR